MSNASKGHDRERLVRELLRADEWWVARAAGSFGDADIVALREGRRPQLIEVKANKTGGAFKNFGPIARSELSAAAKVAGADAVLVHWPSHKPIRFILEKDWPST